MTTRREFLKTGAAGALLLNVAACSRPSANGGQAAVLAALIPVVLEGALPVKDEERSALIMRTVTGLENAIAGLSPATQKEIGELFDLLSFAPVNVAMSIGNGDVDIMEIEIPALLVGRRVGELTIPGEVSVVSISRGNRSIIPALNTVFENRDLVHLAVATASGERLKSLLGLI